jgi:hypothetical protein
MQKNEFHCCIMIYHCATSGWHQSENLSTNQVNLCQLIDAHQVIFNNIAELFLK